MFTLTGNVLWVVGSNGTIYRSPDGGATFQTRSIGTTNYNSITGKAPLNMWIAGDNGTILISTNAGNAFTQYNTGVSENFNSIHFADNNTGWVACTNGKIYESTNGGLNWTQQVTPTANNLSTIKFIDASTGVAGGNNGTILITTNGGSNWNQASLPVNNSILSIDIKNSTIFASCSDGIVLKSTNLGNVWSVIDYKVTTKPDITGISMISSNTYYSCGTGGFIRKSTDGGNTFTFQNNPAWVNLGKIYFYDSTQGWALSSNTNIVLRTINGGANWNMPNGTTQTLSWTLKIPLTYYTSSGNVFYQSSWNKKEIFVTKANTIYRSLDAGQTWNQIGTALPFGQISNSLYVSSRDTNIFLVAIDSSNDRDAKVLRSTNYGQTWSTSFAGKRSSDGTPLAIDPSHPDTVYYGMMDSTLFRSTNFGLSWSAVGTQRFDNVCYIRVLNNNPNIILVGGRDNAPDTLATIFRSSDFGQSWTVVDFNSGEFPELPCIVTSTLTSTLYAAEFEGDNGGVKRSTNLGITWSFINIDNYVWGMDVAKDDPNVMVYADWGGGIGNSGFITYDGGIHFTLLPQIGTQDGNFAVYFYNRNTLFLQQPYGFYKLAATISVPIGIQPVSTEIPKQFSLEQNYPNPFNPATKIKFDIARLPDGQAKQSAVNITIYDAIGREISNIVDERLNAGKYSVDWNAANYPSGVYFYRLQTDNFSETKKMILLK